MVFQGILRAAEGSPVCRENIGSEFKQVQNTVRQVIELVHELR
jgi:hypothetical protein